MYRDSQRDRTIVCRFDPTECGMYIIQVRWSNVDVPGSPFNVHILDTTEELEQVNNCILYLILYLSLDFYAPEGGHIMIRPFVTLCV
ncbi:hypothetical protein DPMN_133468 [Dreissena polymorpha]|uniref:Uncharacterized protein n=1 Tax=Dreissena polymorpha TaxID=45954 RepID=A0A9D4G077_DREPO|nr:hypothetical protein DPMN_133468 [Dreissena polymorpha]